MKRAARETRKMHGGNRLDIRVQQRSAARRSRLAPVERTVCERCGSIQADNSWVKPSATPTFEEKLRSVPPRTTVCPDCRDVDEPDGFVHLDSEFVTANAEAVRRLVATETERAMDVNPLARVVSWSNGSDGIVTLTTATVHLAQRIGRALSNEFTGRVRYELSDDNRLAHVWWHRTT